MTEVIVYTDGACSGNPGPGGWAAILQAPSEDMKKELCGGEKETTNNRMELIAVIRALQTLKKPCRVKIHSDSAYIVNCINQKWYHKWMRNGWRTSTGKAVENKDLWKQLLDLIDTHEVEFIKVKGHSDVQLNNRCDELARAAVPRG